jgi:alkanesulfonate monooxygenase SsuD/methylene tetrahydromethanopterin reductase-like flavin-dependent oxidoreductase (luciferase family)
LKERFERLEETLRIVHQMWGPDDGPFVGTHYQLAETINSPQPLRRPHPPIMIGGGGERKTLRLVARYGDACNLFAGPQTSPAQVAAKLDVLASHCEHEGTDVNRIRKSVLWTGPIHTTDQGGAELAAQLARYSAVGITEVHVMPMGSDPGTFVDAIGRYLVPRLTDLG